MFIGALVALIGAATGWPAPADAAHGSFCSGPGVNVVVDFGALGGGVQEACDPRGAGRTAANVLTAAGFSLEFVQREPGFVCRVDGRPDTQCVETPPADSYWGLFWADGKSARWRYSALAVGSLRVPAGGTVGFAWQDSTAPAVPRVRPPVGAARAAAASGEGVVTAHSGPPATAPASGGLPGWVAPALLAVFLAGAGVTVAVRRGSKP